MAELLYAPGLPCVVVDGRRIPVKQLEVRLTVEDRTAPVFAELRRLFDGPRMKAASGQGLTAEELRRHGPGFEVRMPGMDLPE